jgi:hypothetical protein
LGSHYWKHNVIFIFAEESPSGFSELTLQSFTVEKLRSLLKEKGLSPKGKKASTSIA